MILTLGFIAAPLSAQNTLTVADGSTTNDYVPFYGYYLDANQHCQVIYPDNMLTDMQGSAITQMEFYLNSTPSFTSTITFKMGISSDATFASAAFDNTTTLTEVYVGSINIENNVMTVELNEPYTYNGGNLLLDFTNTTGNYINNISFYGVTASGASVSVYSSWGSATLRDFIPKTTFSYGVPPACSKPTNVAASNITTTDATISWTGDENTSSYNIQYMLSSESDWNNALTATASSETYTLTGLQPSSAYKVRVQAVCSDNTETNWSSVLNFMTACDAITILDDTPWFEGFEGYSGSGEQPFQCWATPVTTTGGGPFVYCGYSASCHNSQNSAELKGANNMLVLPEFTNDIHDLRLSFWATAVTPSNGTLEIGVLPDMDDITSFEVLGLAGTPSSRNGVGNYMGPFDFNGIQASSGRIALRYTSSGTGNSWNLDDFTVELSPSCTSPVKTSVTSTNVDGHNATITWVDNDDTHSSWTVYHKMSTESDNDWLSETAYDTFYTLTGLVPETTYNVYVVTNCGGVPSDDATLTHNFTTLVACPAPTSMTANPIYINEATITWNSMATAFNVEYGETGFSQGTGTTETVYDNTITITNLNSETSYTVYVQADCGTEDGTSQWVSVQFTTLPSCPIPTQIHTSNLTTSSADLEWTPGYEETEWEVKIGIQDFNPDTVVGVIVSGTPFYQIDNLNPDTRYDVYVRAICNADDTSAWAPLYFFLTPCASTPLPYVENFDSYPSWYSPDCWRKFELGNSGGYVSFGAYIYGEQAYSGDKALKFVAGSSTSGYALLRLPDFDTDDITGLQVKMMAKKYSGSRPLIIGVAPDFNSVDSIYVLSTFSDLTNDYAEKIVSLESYPGTVGYIVIGLPKGYSSSATVYVDDLSVEVRPNCMYPTNFATTSVGETSVSIAWTELGSSESWIIEYGPAGFTQGTGITEIVTDSTHYTIENLEESSAYDFYVQSDCNGLGSDWVGPLTVLTSQYIFGVTGSDTVTTCGMTIYDDGGPTGDYNPNCDFTLVLYPSNPDAKMSLTGTITTESGYDYLYVYDGVGTAGTVLFQNSGNKAVNVLSSIGPLTLRFTSDYAYQYAGFELAAMCVTCFPPTDVTVTDVTTTSATVSWSGDASEYGVYVIGSDTTYYTTSDTTLALSDLTPSSTYRVQIQALCSVDESSSLSNAVSFNTSCDAISVTADAPWFEDFESYSSSQFVCWDVPVTYSASNGTFPMVYRGYSPSCHSGANSVEFKGSTNVLVLPPFTNDLSELRLSFWATAVPHPGTGAVEVGYMTDMNDVTSFVFLADAGTPGPRGNSGSGHGNYMGPFDFNGVTAPEGSRIALRYTNASNPTASWNLDDFTVGLVPDCPSPVKTSVTATNVDGHNATISWTDNDPTHTAWIVYYKTSSESDWSFESASTTTLDLTGLDPETTYDVYVVTDCGTTVDNPDATLTIHFTTLIACPAPQNVTVSNIGMSSATVTWFSNADSFTIEYGEAGFTPGSGTTDISTTSTYDLTGLTAGSNYTVYVTADCGADGTSSATSVNFNTALCEVEDQCTYTLNLTDSYGDGWNGASVTIKQNDVTIANATVPSNSSSNTVNVMLCDGQSTTLVWNQGSYDSECYFVLLDPWGNEVFATSGTPSGTLTTFTSSCSPITCPRPADITVSNIGASTAEVSWTSTGTETAWNVEYKVSTDATWTVIPVTTNPYTLTNLTASTNYDVRVQADCGNGDVSDYRETSFLTACDVVTVYPYLEGFEYGLGCWQSVESTYTGYNWVTATADYYYTTMVEGSHFALARISSYSAATVRLVSPIFDLTSITNPYVRFAHAQLDWSGDQDEMSVYYRASSADEWTLLVNYTNSIASFTYDSIALPNPSATYQISFVASNSYGHGVALDDVQVYDNDGAGPWIPTTPTVVTDPATNVTQTTATLNGTITNPDNLTITPMGFEWKEASAFMYNVVNVTGTTMTFGLDNLTPGTQYTYRAFITYNGLTQYGNDVTFTTTAQSQPTDPTVTTAAANPIAQTTATLNATITNPDNVSISAKGFEWKTTLGGTYTQIAGTGTGNSFTANLTGLTANTGYTYKAFITFNGTTVYGSEMTFTTLPEDVEPCEVPTGLTASNITKESFDVSWNAISGVNNWNIRYRVAGGQWTTATSNTNQYAVTGLTAETNYEVQVQADCGDGNLSEWSASLNVTTLVDGINSYLLNSIAVFPNPANDVVNVQCTMNNVQLEGIEVIDVYGKVVRTIVETCHGASLQTRINVSGCAAGMYFVRVTTDEGVVTKTFIKK